MPFTHTNRRFAASGSVNDRFVSIIRTLVPSLYGIGIAWLIKQVPAVGDVLTWLSAELGTDVTLGIQGIAVAVTIAGYHWAARKIGDRFPAVEKWLLGSSLVPTYTAPAADDKE